MAPGHAGRRYTCFVQEILLGKHKPKLTAVDHTDNFLVSQCCHMLEEFGMQDVSSGTESIPVTFRP
jgi:hypothetical protein